MRRKTLANAKLVVQVESDRATGQLYTLSVFDNRTQSYVPTAFIQERGIMHFLNLADLKETLNWNLNGDSSKYQFKWGQSSKEKSVGLAYIFD